jgi:hypothetical protein
MKIHTEKESQKIEEKFRTRCESPARTTLMVIRSIDSIGPQRVTSSFSDFLSPLSLYHLFFFEGKHTKQKLPGPPLTNVQGRRLNNLLLLRAAAAALALPLVCNWINSSEPEINLFDFLNFFLFLALLLFLST